MSKKHSAYLQLLIGVTILMILQFKPTFFSITSNSPKHFNEHLNTREKKATELILNLKNEENTSEEKYLNTEKLDNLYESDGIALFIFNKDQLVFWSNRTIVLPENIALFNKKSGAILLDNGWYQYIKEEEGDKHYLALILIKKEFNIENKYLQNEFHKSFHFQNNFDVSHENGDYPVVNLNGETLVYLTEKPISPNNYKKTNWIILLLFFISVLLITSFINIICINYKKLKPFNYIFVFTFLATFRFLNLSYHFPESVFNQEIFSPLIYAHSIFFPSLGDFLIHIVFFFILIYFTVKFKNTSQKKSKLPAFIFILFIAFLPLLITDLLEGLIKNSKINFDINHILELSAYSFVGIITLLLLYISTIILVKTAFTRFSTSIFTKKQFVSIILSFSVVALIIGQLVYHLQLLHGIWILVVILIFSYKDTSSKAEFNKIILITLVVALSISYGFINFSVDKVLSDKQFVAKNIAKEQDPITEYLFKEVKTKMEADTFLQNNLHHYWDKKIEFDKYINNKYFGGFWNNYILNIYQCNITDTIIINETNENANCLDFFKTKIKTQAYHPESINKDINFLYSNDGISSYLGNLVIQDSSKQNDKNSYLFIEFFPQSYSKAIGYPELLLNEKEIEKSFQLNKFSYAKFRKGKLVSNSGEINYTSEWTGFFVQPKVYNFALQKTSNNEHLIYQSDRFTTIIVSAKKKDYIDYITTFSYLFLITSLVFFVISVFIKAPPFSWLLSLTDFSSKIQFFIISTILLSFLLYGWGTTYYIEKQYVNKNKKILREKVQSLIIELDQKFGEHKELTKANLDEMTYYLIKFSNVFYTDVNLYDKNGELLATSRSEIYDVGLLSPRMDRNAYENIHYNKRIAYINNENIGELDYLSAYVPFTNRKNKFLAYVNLPYFAKQNEFENELSEFFTALINIYGLLFLISVIIAVFFANYISEPLRLIRQKISALQFGQSYEVIHWNSNDEIGALVKEYNKKVMELEANAQKLAKSERESAWREMAKQVAHEIKNPLTPMKLSVQHLQRFANENTGDLQEKIKNTTNMLIEQIDTLANIANAFSNFAKMPKANTEKIDLIPIIKSTINLFEEDDNKNYTILLSTKLQSANIVADKNQIIRVFTNLIKNATQAITSEKNGIIEIVVTSKNNSIQIIVKDNGIGISEEQKTYIFTPSFTTKNKGMGLGLAMVKNIIENIDGTIRFESIPNEATSFIIEIPTA
ncbi:MAG: ATP-binding protein [Flavobacteriales bacterium]|nr:ATP-binding protein [Flavobacteriales bacterium]